MPEDMEKVLAPFSSKGPAIKRVHKEGDKEHYFDIMEREFRPFNLHGKTDPSSPDVIGNEEEFVEVARQARDDRLVGMADGRVVRAGGSLKEGTGMLYDMNGRPLGQGNVQQAPVKPTRRNSNREW